MIAQAVAAASDKVHLNVMKITDYESQFEVSLKKELSMAWLTKLSSDNHFSYISKMFMSWVDCLPHFSLYILPLVLSTPLLVYSQNLFVYACGCDLLSEYCYLLFFLR